MIITISGELGSGKSTVARIIAKRLGLEHFSTGDFFRRIAKEKGVTVADLNKRGESSDELDQRIDAYTKGLGETKDDFIIDSRLAWYFIPQSFKVYLTVDDKEAARRIFHDERQGEQAKSAKEMLDEIKDRRASELKRYQRYYGINLEKKEHYDLVIDTTDISAEQVADRIIDAIKSKKD